MKITKIDLLYCDPVEGGWRPSLCRIYTDEGIYGDGEVALSYGGASQAAFAMLKDMANRLIGMNPLDYEVIWQKLYQGVSGVTMEVLLYLAVSVPLILPCGILKERCMDSRCTVF